MIVIPTSNVPFYQQTVSLDGVDYVFSFKYNQREYAWYFDLLTAEGDPVKSGMKLVYGIPLLGSCLHVDRPLGDLIVVSTSGLSPGLDDLLEDGDAELVYFSLEDISAL